MSRTSFRPFKLTVVLGLGLTVATSAKQLIGAKLVDRAQFSGGYVLLDDADGMMAVQSRAVK